MGVITRVGLFPAWVRSSSKDLRKDNLQLVLEHLSEAPWDGIEQVGLFLALIESSLF